MKFHREIVWDRKTNKVFQLYWISIQLIVEEEFIEKISLREWEIANQKLV